MGLARMDHKSPPLTRNDTPPAAPQARFFVLIPCAGSGSRAGTAQPKQYQPVAGRPLVMHTLEAFAAVPRIAAGLVVVAPGDTFFRALPALPPPFAAADCGGPSRAASVLNGLRALLADGASPEDWALVHDAARCLVTSRQIETLIDACAQDSVGGLLALKLPDTLKQASAGRVAATVDRSDKWLAQTPQMFRIGVLADALQRAGDAATDEASAMEALGHRPLLVAGGAQNFKVTYPDDFALADAVLRSRT